VARPPIVERSDVLVRLTRAFRTNGFHGTTLTALASEVGLQKASLYHLFPGGKVEMARAVLHSVLEGFARLRRPQASPAERFGGFETELRSYFGHGEQACLLGNLALSQPGEPLKRELRGAFERWRDALVEIQMAHGRDKGTARLAAEAAIARLEGSLILARGLEDPAILERAFEELPVLLGFDE
jgi:TetR/AcrR family transcriptional repressor of lmrAB and yxaGH operons